MLNNGFNCDKWGLIFFAEILFWYFFLENLMKNSSIRTQNAL